MRRSRAGWTWPDGGDVPLGEEAERYRVTLGTDAGAVTVETTVPALLLDAAMIAAAGPAPVPVAVAMIGTAGLSRPARITLPGVQP